MGIRFPLRKKAPCLRYHQKKHSTVIDCLSWKMPGKPSHPTVSFCKWRGWTQKENGTLIFSGRDRMLALCGGKNIYCVPDTVLSLSSNLIFHLFNKYFWSTYCVLVHLGTREEIYVFCTYMLYIYTYISILLLVLSIFYNNNKFQLPVSLPHSSWPQGTETHREV